MNLLEVKDTALSFMKPAKAEVLKWYRGQFSIDLKADESPVTIADRNAEEILRKKFHGTFPNTESSGKNLAITMRMQSGSGLLTL